MNFIEDYLSRIGLSQAVEHSISGLKILHRSHVLHVPFEDFEIHLNNPIVLDISSLFEKVVINHRGGFCYELNYLFHYLLTKLGYEARMISAKVYNEEGGFGPPFDHMAIIVKLDKLYLLDVGFGDLFIEPLSLEESAQKDRAKYYKLLKVGEEYDLMDSKDGLNYRMLYRLTVSGCKIRDFLESSYYKQYDPRSHFLQRLICTKATENGRIILKNQVFTEIVGASRNERKLQSEEDLASILNHRFRMNLSISEINHLYSCINNRFA